MNFPIPTSAMARQGLLAAAMAFFAGFAGVAHAQVVYTQDFNSASGSGLLSSTSERWASTNYWTTFPSLSGWLLFGGAMIAQNGTSADRALLLNETPFPAITYTSTPISGLTSGSLYQLTFQHWGDNMPGSTPYAFDVMLNSGVLGSISRAYSSTGSGAFATESYTFTAPGSSINLSFLDKSTGAASGIVDNISIAAIPEPETWAMMLAGLSFLGWASRRRRERQLAAA